jgi:hypothetical protein
VPARGLIYSSGPLPPHPSFHLTPSSRRVRVSSLFLSQRHQCDVQSPRLHRPYASLFLSPLQLSSLKEYRPRSPRSPRRTRHSRCVYFHSSFALPSFPQFPHRLFFLFVQSFIWLTQFFLNFGWGNRACWQATTKNPTLSSLIQKSVCTALTRVLRRCRSGFTLSKVT